MARRNILDSIRATHWVEGTGGAGAVGVAQRKRPVETTRSEQFH